MQEVGKVVEAYNLYGNLSEYQLSLLSKDTENILKQYVEKANELMASALVEDTEATENTAEGIDEIEEQVEVVGEKEDL